MLSVIARPFVLFLYCYLVLYPIRRAVIRFFPEGRVKRILLFDVSNADSYRRPNRTKTASSDEGAKS